MRYLMKVQNSEKKGTVITCIDVVPNNFSMKSLLEFVEMKYKGYKISMDGGSIIVANAKIHDISMLDSDMMKRMVHVYIFLKDVKDSDVNPNIINGL